MTNSDSHLAPLAELRPLSEQTARRRITHKLGWLLAVSAVVAALPVASATASTSSTKYVPTGASFFGSMGSALSTASSNVPTQPGGVIAKAASATSVTLTWGASLDPNFSYFAVRRSSDPTLAEAQWKRLPGNDLTTTVTDNNLTASTTYYYYVTEIDMFGTVSARSAVASATTLTIAPPTVFAGMRLTTDGQLAPYANRASSTLSSSYADQSFPLTVQSSGHYASNVPDPTGLPRNVIQLATDESLGDGASVRVALYSPDNTLTAGHTYWIINELYLPCPFPKIASNGWYTWGSTVPRGLIGSGYISPSMLLRNGQNTLTWKGEGVSGVPVLWDSKAATCGMWHIMARHVYLSQSNSGWMEIYYGTRGDPATGAPAQPLTLQTLNPASGVTLTNNDTRRTNFATMSPSSISPYPGLTVAIYNYHLDNMAGFSGQTKLDTGTYAYEDTGSISVKQVDPYYNGTL
jgi:Fibronectin type III domain